MIDVLLNRGVKIIHPASVYIAESVRPERIHEGATIYPGCRITGAQTSLGPGCELGREAPVTLENCQLGSGVHLKGGYYAESTFLSKASMGSAAHIRPGTLIEEEAGGAHAVGLKQTVLLPFVTLGSMINFCDCLMAGGTSRTHHSEVGSSYIHFNFTPHGDKATASMMGDVPRGVMLDRDPIFLGGQGGLVGPVRIDYGTVIPAGTVWRKDVNEEGLLLRPSALPGTAGSIAYRQGAYKNVRRIVRRQLEYIGNIVALLRWYELVRKPIMTEPFSVACREGACTRLNMILDERIKRLDQLAENMGPSLDIARSCGKDTTSEPYCSQQQLLNNRSRAVDYIRQHQDTAMEGADIDSFMELWSASGSGSCVERIQQLSEEGKRLGRAMLQRVVDGVKQCEGLLFEENE